MHYSIIEGKNREFIFILNDNVKQALNLNGFIQIQSLICKRHNNFNIIILAIFNHIK